MDLTIVPKDDGVAVAEMGGDLHPACASEVRTGLATAVTDGHRRLVVDLTQVAFIDSSGLGALISGLKSARQAGGDLRIAGPGGQARGGPKRPTLDRAPR